MHKAGNKNEQPEVKVAR